MSGISAVVATYRRKDVLRKLFESILKSNCAVEVIVVDQNQPGYLDDFLASYSDKLHIRHLRLDEANQSKARNIGARHATNPIICFPDDDCWFDDHVLDVALADFQAQNIDMLIIDWRQKSRDNQDGSSLTQLDHHAVLSYNARINYATYTMLIRTAKFHEIGGFNEDIGIGKYIGAGEDAEIVFRAARMRLRLYHHTGVFVNHRYTQDKDRSIEIVRSRQRAPGFIYSHHKLRWYVVVRGLLSPLVKSLFSNSKLNFNIFLARLEGVKYGRQYNRKLSSSEMYGDS